MLFCNFCFRSYISHICALFLQFIHENEGDFAGFTHWEPLPIIKKPSDYGKKSLGFVYFSGFPPTNPPVFAALL